MNENHAQLLLSRDAILGIYLATRDQPEARVQAVFASLDTAEEAFELGEVALEATIEVRVQGKRVRTTVGRALVARCIPETGIPDAPLQRTSLHALLEALCVSHGLREAVRASRELETLGLAIVAQGGLSLGMDDLAPAEGKKALVAEARAHVEQVAEEFRLGMITDGERYNRSVDLWATYTDRIWQATSQPKPAPQHDLMFSLVDAEAAGKRGNLRRLVAMPGCSAKPNGEILDVPVTQSFGEGLSPHEHFVDTRDLRAYAIRERGRRVRAAAMERRLYRALRGVKVVEDDCGTSDGLRVTALVEAGRVVRTLRAQVEGLFASEPVRDRFGTARMPRGARIEGEALDDVTEVWVRWPYACRSRGGVCRVCSGGRTGLEAGRALSAAAALLPADLVYPGSYCGPGSVKQPNLKSLEVLLDAPSADRARLAPCDGIVHVDRARSRVWIAAAGASKRLVRIRDLTLLEVLTGDWVACGDALTDGTPSPHDQLRVRGAEWLAASLAERLMREFGLEHDATSLLHVGLLVRAMLSRVRVVRPQGTSLRKGSIVTREVWEAANAEASARGRAPAMVVPVLTPLSVLGR